MPVKQAPYDVGDDIQLEATFTDATDQLTDPTSITLELVCPDGSTITYAKVDLTNPSLGVWRRIYTVANGWGVYKVTWTGTGGFAIVEQDSFRVREPAA